ncbi:MAG: HdeD family acid-resistance protein [Leptolyngbyaceae cyanobacterium MO_188.B28]|nr:HdeD family acid-resistance protein [Leptolyngbyaceae cyanobacterium MO_188.B28]
MSTEERSQTMNILQERFGWTISLGILMIILGILAIAQPHFSTQAVARWLGWIFIVGGIGQLIHVFQTHRVGPLMLKLGLSILYVIAGGLLLQHTVESVLFITLVAGILFLIEGISRVILSFQLKAVPNWWWMLGDGVVTLILGIFIASQWPSAALWVIGLLVGIGLLIDGLSTIMFSMAGGGRHTLGEAR